MVCVTHDIQEKRRTFGSPSHYVRSKQWKAANIAEVEFNSCLPSQAHTKPNIYLNAPREIQHNIVVSMISQLSHTHNTM